MRAPVAGRGALNRGEEATYRYAEKYAGSAASSELSYARNNTTMHSRGGVLVPEPVAENSFSSVTHV